jgi:hypothetical protein
VSSEPGAGHTLKEATVRRYHYDTHRDLREHLEAFLNAYNFAKRLKTLKGLTPYEHICNVWGRPAEPIQIRSTPPHFGTEHLGTTIRPKAAPTDSVATSVCVRPVRAGSKQYGREYRDE